MAQTKPLPVLNAIPPLTIDGRTHLSDIVRYSVTARSLRTVWVPPLQSALLQFAQWVSQAEFLQDIRASRVNSQANIQPDKENEASAAKDSDAGTASIASLSSDKDQDSTKRDTQLIRRLYKSLQEQKPGLKHVLLTVAAPPAAVTAQELEFQVVPASQGCTFETSSFHFPFFEDQDGTTLGDGGSILSGLDVVNEGDVQIIGGSFRLQGLTTVNEYRGLVQVLEIGVYTILSLCLELTLMRDSSVQLRFPPDPILVAPSLPVANAALSHGARERAIARAAKTRDGIWSYLAKHSGQILGRARTISQGSNPAVIQVNGAGVERPKSPVLPPFSATVNGIKECENVLSTSPGIQFPPPILLTELAEKEAQTGYSDLTAAQHVGLRSILGWTVDHQLSGPSAFLRHQSITVLYSEYVPNEVEKVDEEDGAHSTVSWLPCVQRHWDTLQYYSKDRDEDHRLGEFVMEKCGNATTPCSRKDCKFQIHSHQLRWVTGRKRIIAKMHSDLSPPSEGISMWLSCQECGTSTHRRPMADGTWLLSFGKYLELLTYSTDFANIQPPLCDHTKVTSKDDLLKNSFNIIRNFAYNSYIISFTASPVGDVYEVRIPRVQITKHRALKAQNEGLTIRDNWQEHDRDKLRLEITLWWRGVKEHMTQLEEILDDANGDNPLRKPLPPSPPHEKEGTDDAPTPKAPPKLLLPETGANTPHDHKHNPSSSISSATTSSTSTPSLGLLSNLRRGFNATEQALYASLNNTPATSINDARRLFHSAAKAASNRLAAWEKKHVPGLGAHMHYKEPEWWSHGYHALPGGSIIVKEDEWASIIAFTLSSSDYSSELIEMSYPRAASSVGAVAGSVAPSSSVITSASGATAESAVSKATSVEAAVSPSLAAFVASMQVFSGSKPTAATLDPDDESQASHWHVPESLNPQISRKDNPKEGSNILSLRDVLRNKAHPESASKFSNSSSSVPNSMSKLGTKAPPSAFGSASLEVATQHAQGTVHPPTPAAVDVFEQILLDVEGDEYTLVDSLQSKTPTGTIRTNNPLPATANSLAPPKPPDGKLSMLLPPPTVPPKDYPTPSTSAATTPTVEKSWSEVTKGDSMSSANHSNTTGDENHATFAMGTLTSTIANAMRYVLNVGQAYEDKPLPSAPYHGLLAMESPDIDSRPHIRYDCAVGKRLKFSCTVYYAKQFDSLRRRCGVDEILIQSLKKTEHWSAEGGKSKSNFWKTSDNRFIIKTLVDAWNVDDLQVLIELGPSYFRYMDKTAKKPSVMAKLLGFFTVELKNLETGVVQSKADLLVMENLFYERTISQTFDLKGIEGRKIKPSGKGPQSKTLFDGEWLEGQKKALILLHPHSKTVLEEGISEDAEFLASSNIMDYSLLLGVDDEQKAIAAGLVDTIGSYTFAKTLEYKAKQNIKKHVTVIPPNEYRDRFVRAINSYFVACPDKWSHPGPDFVFPNRLPSVL